MKPPDQTTTLGHLAVQAPEILRDLAETQRPIIILEGGIPRAVLQDIARYAVPQETLALLKVLAITTQASSNGKIVPARPSPLHPARQTRLL
jgi:hypothetical protein